MDEDAMDSDLVSALRYRGATVTTAYEAGQVGSPDETQLDTATERGLVLYTCNVADFYSLHTRRLEQGRHHAGIILAPQQRFPVREQLRRMLRIRASISADDMRDRVEFLGNWE